MLVTDKPAWIENADKLSGPLVDRFQRELAKYNSRQLKPSLPRETWREDLEEFARVSRAEGDYIEAIRQQIAPLTSEVPIVGDQFVDWFEELKRSGPGQQDPLFPWLAEGATLEEMLWFVTQEVA